MTEQFLPAPRVLPCNSKGGFWSGNLPLENLYVSAEMVCGDMFVCCCYCFPQSFSSQHCLAPHHCPFICIYSQSLWYNNHQDYYICYYRQDKIKYFHVPGSRLSILSCSSPSSLRSPWDKSVVPLSQIIVSLTRSMDWRKCSVKRKWCRYDRILEKRGV